MPGTLAFWVGVAPCAFCDAREEAKRASTLSPPSGHLTPSCKRAIPYCVEKPLDPARDVFTRTDPTARNQRTPRPGIREQPGQRQQYAPRSCLAIMLDCCESNPTPPVPPMNDPRRGPASGDRACLNVCGFDTPPQAMIAASVRRPPVQSEPMLGTAADENLPGSGSPIAFDWSAIPKR